MRGPSPGPGEWVSDRVPLLPYFMLMFFCAIIGVAMIAALAAVL